MKLKIPYIPSGKALGFFLIVLFVFAVSSCRDLESVIDTSKNSISYYGAEVYMDGYFIGTRYYATKAEEDFIRRELEKGKLWDERVITIPAKTVYYRDANNKPSERLIPASVKRTRLDCSVIADVKNEKKLLVAVMIVPESETKDIRTYFVFHRDEKNLYAQEESASEPGFPKSVRALYGQFLPPDLAPYKEAQKTGLDPFNDFEVRKQITLKRSSSLGRSILYVNSGIDWYYYKGWSNTAIVRKADTEMTQEVSPLVVAFFKGDVAWANMFFKTDLRFALNNTGTMDTGDKAMKAMGLGKRSYLIDLAAGFLGLETKVAVQKWNMGESKYYTSTVAGSHSRDRLMNSENFVLEKKQLDLRYHTRWRDIPRLGGESRNQKMWDIYFGYRYMSMTRPGLIYSYESVKKPGATSEDDTEFQVNGESPPQRLTLRNHLLGFGANNYLRAENPGFNFLFSADLYFGYGYSDIKVIRVKNGPLKGDTLRYGVLVPCESAGIQYVMKSEKTMFGVKFIYTNDIYAILHPADTAVNNFFEMFHSLSLSAELKI